MARSARQCRDAEREVRALFLLASALSWIDREASLETAAAFVALAADNGDVALIAEARSWSAYWSLLWVGFDDADARASAESIVALRRGAPESVLGTHLARHAAFACLCSNYDNAVSAAREAEAIARRGGDGFEFLLARFFLAWALFFDGRWDELFALLEDSIAFAERSAQPRWVVVFRERTELDVGGARGPGARSRSARERRPRGGCGSAGAVARRGRCGTHDDRPVARLRARRRTRVSASTQPARCRVARTSGCGCRGLRRASRVAVRTRREPSQTCRSQPWNPGTMIAGRP